MRPRSRIWLALPVFLAALGMCLALEISAAPAASPPEALPARPVLAPTATPTPLPFPTPLVYPMSQRYKAESLFDHTNPAINPTPDNYITAYTGAAVQNDAGDDDCDWWSGGTHIYVYQDLAQGEYWTDLRWNQDLLNCPESGGPGWLAYDGHAGYDCSCTDGTAVNAAGQGTAEYYGSDAIIIRHGWNSYQTWYRHLSNRTVTPGPVIPGQNIGATGSGHLHFEVQHYANGAWRLIDPYGWSGGGGDPWQYDVGNLWLGGSPADPVPMGYRDQNNASHGPFQLDDPTIRNKWLTVARSLGSPIEDDCLLSGSCPPPWPGTPACEKAGQHSAGLATVERFERGYIYYCSDGVAVAKNYYYTYLPRVLASKTASGWDSHIYVRNLSSSPTTASITLYTNDGRVLDSRVYDGLPASATWEVNVRDVLMVEFLNRQEYTPVFTGAAVVAADHDVVVVVSTEKSDEVMAYTGVSTLNGGTGWGQPGTKVYAPTVFYNPAWESGSLWQSTLHIQNAGNATANFTIYYYNRDGLEQGHIGGLLPVYGEQDYTPPDNWAPYEGAAYIQSDRNLAVVVTQEDFGTDRRASQYNAFSSGANVVYVPSVMHDWYYWLSSFTVQNVGSSATNITVKYYGEGVGDYGCTLTNLQPNSSCIVVQDQPDPSPACPRASGSTCDVPANWQGSVVMTATQPIVAIVNQRQDNSSANQHSHQSYSGFIGGRSTVYAPFAANCWTSGNYIYRSSSHVQNVGKQTVTVGTWNGYFWDSGAQATGGTLVSRAAGRVAMFYVPVEGVPASFKGSVKATCTASTCAGIHNYARGLSSQSCAAPEGEKDDYGASYNLPQR